MVEFKPWPKIGRDNPFNVTITEKMDGTNACIIIENGEIVGVQSRKRFIKRGDDNFAFALWVHENNDDLLNLGDGYHYGEWAGVGIQSNPHALVGRKFFLFNSFRWNDSNKSRPACCDVVPVLFSGLMTADTVPTLLAELKAQGEATGTTPEGVIVYYHGSRTYSKHTIISPNGKWCKG